MNYSFKTISALALLSIIGFSSCSKESKSIESAIFSNAEEISIPKEHVLKPIPTRYQEMVKAERFQLDASKDFAGTTRNGMKVNIPKDVLVDENNQPITGDVELEVKEYYSPAEIIVSNIPMEYMDGDELKHFQSDGMFTITATQKGKELKVVEGKNITLTTKRSKEGSGYEFYALEDNKWVKDKDNKVEELPVSDKRIPVLKAPKRPVQPMMYDLVKFNSNYYTVEKDQRNELAAHNSTVHTKTFYDENTVKQINIDVKANPWILNKKKWHFVKNRKIILKKDDVAQIDFDTIKYRVLYAIRGNKKYQELKTRQEEEKAQYDKDLATYKKDIVAYNENYDARRKAGQLTVSETQELVIAQFGTFNIDRYFSQPQKLLVEKNYDISIPKNIDPSDRVFLVVKGNDETLIPVDLGMYAPLVRFNKKEKNALIVMSEEKVYAINREDFEKMANAHLEAEKFDFQMKDELTFSTTEEFNELLENLF